MKARTCKKTEDVRYDAKAQPFIIEKLDKMISEEKYIISQDPPDLLQKAIDI